MIEFEVSLLDSKIYMFTEENINVDISIYGDETLVFWTKQGFIGKRVWFMPDRNLMEFEVVRVEIKDTNKINLLWEEIIEKNRPFYAEFNSDKYIRGKYFSDYSFKGTMIELGAGPPVWLSMSKHFRDNGWRCICIDPNPKFVQQHKEVGNEIYQYACSDEDKDSTFDILDCHMWAEENEGVSGSALSIKYDLTGGETMTTIPVKVKKLNTLLTEISVEHIDFISVDVEGWELEVMRGFDLNKYNPTVVLLENVGHDVNYTEYMEGFGYHLDKKIEYNYIYTKITNSPNYYGQSKEDFEIQKYFPNGFTGGCIDVGATNGRDINNTLHFEESGWFCMCIEPNPVFYNQLKNNRNSAINFAISNYNKDDVDFNVVTLPGNNQEAVSALSISDRLMRDHQSLNPIVDVIKTKVRTLDHCIENYYTFDKIDFISIDTEGTELDVLKGFNINKWQPKLFIVENNYNDKDIEDYMDSFGYKLDKKVSVNDFYIKNNLI